MQIKFELLIANIMRGTIWANLAKFVLTPNFITCPKMFGPGLNTR